MKTRSNEPIFWSLFGAGGLVVAFILPALIFVTGVGVPLAIMPEEVMSYDRIHAFASGWFGKVSIFLVISLSLWHGLHRIFLSLHDFGIGGRALFSWLLYGTAFIGTVATCYLLIQI
ncbi:MAG: fumarate reductase subunit D [Pseudomonadales bacterium]|nr:fumarate reductase subunit D [Pseudomonadales bacterium]